MARRGGRDIKTNIAKPPLMERTGWWFKIKPKCFEPEPPPRLRRFGCFALSSYWRSHPSWPGRAMARSAKWCKAPLLQWRIVGRAHHVRLGGQRDEIFSPQFGPLWIGIEAGP